MHEFTAIFSDPKVQRHIKSGLPESELLNEWKILRDVMWSRNGIVSPNRFVNHVQELAKEKDRELFTGWAQNDLPEFLLFMIECMHNSLSRHVTMKIVGNVGNPLDQLAIECYTMLQHTYQNEYSEMMDMFYGIYVSELSSVDGTTVHARKPESYFILDLEVLARDGRGMHNSLYECFDSFTGYETLEGDHAWFNESTGRKEDVRKRIVFWNFPSILVITLKRFRDEKSKLSNVVSFPLHGLDLARYNTGYNPSQYVYDLFGVCNHSGNTRGGHYTSFVQTQSGEWVHFNDTVVERHIPETRIVSAKAYCLFYRKRRRPWEKQQKIFSGYTNRDQVL